MLTVDINTGLTITVDINTGLTITPLIVFGLSYGIHICLYIYFGC